MFNVLCKLFKDLQPAELASVTIGRGAFGRVFSTSLDNNDFAIKICPISPCSCRGERNSLSLRHPNIVKTHEIIELRPDDLSLFFTDSYLSNFNSVSLFKSIGLQMVIMEAAGSMSLETCINDPNEVIDRERRNYILYQISAGLAYCHDQRILHLDLKPSNIMISSDDTCKLVDFGCSLNLEPGHDHRGRIRCGGQPPPGTIPYTSPELFRGAKPTEKADIYKVEGVCLDKPKVYYKDNYFTPEVGKWNICDKKIIKGCKVSDKRWFIVNLSRLEADIVKQFGATLRAFSNDKGATIGEPEYWSGGYTVDYDCKAVERILRSIYDKYHSRQISLPSLIMFIITRTKDDSVYHEIKQYGDVKYGFNTQCILESNVKSVLHEKGFFLLSNVFLKMNAKLGGINNIISEDGTSNIIGKKSTIIMGADVTHPTEKMSYSIAA